jgi:hypothetical protein
VLFNRCVMKISNMLKRVLGMGPVVHPVDRGLAKRWIKQRLVAVFPELRNNPKALEAAYHSLSLEPRSGEDGENETVFEIGCHREPEN